MNEHTLRNAVHTIVSDLENLSPEELRKKIEQNIKDPRTKALAEALVSQQESFDKRDGISK